MDLKHFVQEKGVPKGVINCCWWVDLIIVSGLAELLAPAEVAITASHLRPDSLSQQLMSKLIISISSAESVGSSADILWGRESAAGV